MNLQKKIRLGPLEIVSKHIGVIDEMFLLLTNH